MCLWEQVPVSVSYYYEVDNDVSTIDSGDNTYLSLDYSTDLSEDWGLSLHYGVYDIDANADEQIDMSLTLSKGDFSFSIVETDDMDATSLPGRPGHPCSDLLWDLILNECLSRKLIPI
jgi:hypothetical protein